MISIRRGFPLVVVALAALLVAGCSSGQDFPTGRWTASEPGGVMVIDFKDDGTHVVTTGTSLIDQRQVDAGTYEADGDTLEFRTDSYCMVNGGAEQGTYAWSLDGGRLTFTVADDPCADRRELLDGSAMTPIAAQSGATATAEAVDAPVPWWNELTFYEVFVRSYSDSNGDGIGDLRGLIDKLDYLNDGDPATDDDLGVSALWLMPITQSPSYHGYDTTDYFTVEEDYGTNADFAALVAQAHARGMRVIVDLVLNHTSSEHPWFSASAGDAASPKRDWYVWSATDPGQATPWGTQAWHRSGDAYYLGLFWEGMPDLNYRNPVVTEQMYDVARYWIDDMGADGFRLDAVRHLIEEDGSVSGTPATHEWLVAWDDYVDSVDPDALTVGEVWDDTSVVAPYVTDDEVDLAFEFALAGGILSSANSGDAAAYRGAVANALAAYPAGQFAPFLTNHDQNRVMSMLGGDAAKAKLAASALLTLPGVPFLYYGEEIGMVGQKPDEQIRTPMQWDGSANAGFTDGTAWQPVNGDYPEVNVAAQATDPDSLLAHYRALIRARTDHAALRTGGLMALASSCRDVVAHLRTAPDGGDTVLVLLNFADSDQSGCAFDGAASKVPGGTYEVTDLLTEEPAAGITVAEDGSITGYAPLPTLSPRQAALLHLQQPAGG